MADQSTIREYVAAGWSLVPLARGQKHPTDEQWRTTTYAVQDFADGGNVGVKLGDPSGGLVDIDLDCKEAVALAKDLLPKTGCVFGRKSKPASHYFFVVPGLKSKPIKGVDGKVMLEIRSTGGQTMLPGSTHPEGEAITWDQHRPPMHLDPKEFELSVARLAVATLIARNWPAGGRHVASGHLGGVLARCGYLPIEVEETVRAVVTAVGEGEWADDNARFARESAEKLAAGELKVTGGPAFRECFPNGVDVLRKIYELLGREGDEHIDKMNEKHFVVPLGKDMVVGTEENDGVTFQTFNGFEQRYYNVFIGKKKLGKFWLEHERCRKHARLVFAPPPVAVPDDAYNLWRGFACEPLAVVDEAPISRYLHHIHEVICSGNGDHTNYVLDLFAVTVQQPGVPTGKALALRGGQGVGKSVLFKSFGSLFGRHFMTISSRKHITGEFNAHLSGKVVVFADEAIWGGNRQDVGTLKRLITENTLVIERKGIDSVEELNCMHLFMATNEDWVFPAGDKERRGVIIDVTNEQSPDYYRALWEEVKSPAFGPALLAYLQARDVSTENWRRSLDTSALREQQDMSSDVVRLWWKTKLEDGKAGDGVAWPEFVTNNWLYDNFLYEMRGTGSRENPMTFGRKLRKLLPSEAISEVRKIKVNVAPHGLPQWEKRNCRGYVIPNLAVCRRYYDKLTGTRQAWEVPIEESNVADPELMNSLDRLEEDDDL